MTTLPHPLPQGPTPETHPTMFRTTYLAVDDTDPQGITPAPAPDVSTYTMETISEGSMRGYSVPRRALNTDIDWSQENASAEREKWRERMIIWGVGLLVAFFGGFLGIAAAQWALR